MPCWQKNYISYELKIDPKIFIKAIKPLAKELRELSKNIEVQESNSYLRIKVGRKAILVDYENNEIIADAGMEAIVNMIKRQYSMAVVKHAATRGMMQSKFNMKQVGTRRLVLSKR